MQFLLYRRERAWQYRAIGEICALQNVWLIPAFALAVGRGNQQDAIPFVSRGAISARSI
jgi:hypothetical protein